VTIPSTPTNQAPWIRIANWLLLVQCLFFAALLIYKVVKEGRGVNLPLALSCAVLATVFAWALRASPENKARICLVSVSSILTLLALEVCVLLLKPSLTFGEPIDPKITLQEKLTVLNELRRSGPAYPAVVPHQLTRSNGLAAGSERIFPLAGISRTMTVLAKESGFWKTYVSDEYGFNNPPGTYSGNAPAIVLIGDSFVHGASVKEGDDMAGRMRQLGQPAINLGFWANGSLLELATLSEYGLRSQPRAVFWIYFEGNDLPEMGDEKNSALLAAYLNDGHSQHLADRQEQVDQVLKQYCEEKERKLTGANGSRPHARRGRLIDRARNWPIVRIVRLVHLRDLAKAAYHRRQMMTVGWEKKRVTEDELSLFQKILVLAAQKTKQSGAEFYFVYLPDQTRFSQKMADSGAWRYRDKVLSIVESLKMPCLDLSEEIARHPDPLSLYISRSFYSHFNAAGNEFVARACLKRLQADRK
jgi:hypothetical protein